MIKLPSNHQQIHTFENDGVSYVANLEKGEVIEIDALSSDILTLSKTNDQAAVLKSLSNKYAEVEILEALKTLRNDVGEFLFQAQAASALAANPTQQRLRIFIPHGFMKYNAIMSPTLNVGVYNLLAALTKYADVFVEADNNPEVIEQREHLKALGIEFVSDLFESKNSPIHASNRFIIEDCDGILALSPHPHEELNYFRHNTIPIVSRAFSDRRLREATINKVLSHHSLKRSFDCVCPDTPWIGKELEMLTGSDFDGLNAIPSGVDGQVYSPQDHERARETVAAIVGEKSILTAPFVGVINGFQPQNSIGIIQELANLHKDVVFIVLDSILSHHRSEKPRNVFYIDLQRPEDTVVLPWIYSACEFVIFPSVIGTPFSMVLDALACGVPALALTSTHLPENLENCVKSVSMTRDATTGKFVIPTLTVSEQIDQMLSASEIRMSLSRRAREVALTYSWDRTARHFIELFTALNAKKQKKAMPTYPDVAFSSYYDKVEDVIRNGAMQLDGFFRHGIEEGLAQTLLAEHTPEEVRTVLRYLLKDIKKADSLISTLVA